LINVSYLSPKKEKEKKNPWVFKENEKKRRKEGFGQKKGKG